MVVSDVFTPLWLFSLLSFINNGVLFMCFTQDSATLVPCVGDEVGIQILFS